MSEVPIDCIHWEACLRMFDNCHGFIVYKAPIIKKFEAMGCGTSCRAYCPWNTRAESTCEGCKHINNKAWYREPCYSCTHENYNDCYEVSK